jgi:hydrogenase nickel incorporation protein HypA/HybF
MHELPATQDILATALETARSAGATRITAVDIVIGDLTSMVDDSVQFYFDVLSRGTAAAGARLRLRRIAAHASCSGCGATYEVTPPLSPSCESCGSFSISVRGGREFFIESIQVDE